MVCPVHYGGLRGSARAAARRSARSTGWRSSRTQPTAPTPPRRAASEKLGTIGLAGAFSFFSNKIFSCGEGGLLATSDDAVAEFARSRRSHAMTSGTWDRHRGHALGYDVVGVGYNYRMDEPRAALLSARLPGLADDIRRRREVTRRYRELLADVPGSSCRTATTRWRRAPATSCR